MPEHIHAPTVTALPAVLTADDLCRALRMSRAQFQRLRRAGTFPIPALPGLDRRVRFSGEAVRRYLSGEVVLPRRRRA
jgi:predicted DNA-binding transcriptional regulator AlpA